MSPIPYIRARQSLFASALALSAVLISTSPATAQEVAPPATPNADRLAEEMRVLARDPRNVRALLSAGELSARLNDPSAAASFFARAQALDPGNPRVRAGQAMVMVRMERPGEALRLLAEAERAGLNLDDYASDRGLAYDLIGAQAHAQRDHRVAMRRNPDDETRRRYALSLGISGNSREAMDVLEPLLRRSDRAAWRARAFIMAMSGDAAGADKIAASMMGGFGTALSPFFRRLPALPAADKAFAVHFGEIRRTPARIADATLAPPLPVLRGEPGVVVAAAQPVRVPTPVTSSVRAAVSQPARTPRESRRQREQRQAAEASAAQQREAQRQAELRAQQAEAQRLAMQAQQERDAAAARQREAARLAAEQAARDAEARRVAEVQAREAEARRVAEAQARERAAEAEAARVRETQRVAAAQTPAPSQVQPSAAAALPSAAAVPVEGPAAQAASVGDTSPAATTANTAPAPTAAMGVPPRIGREDNVIARIIAGITIPASELGVAPMPGEQRTETALAAVEAPQPVVPVQGARTTPAAAAERPQPAAAKPAAKPKATEPKVVDAKPKPVKAADAKTAKGKAKPEPAKAEPARQWVQVAGGANVTDLPKTLRGLAAKAPAEFKGKQAWTTPLRFTNRLLVGPFKTSAEAQGFVNAIGKKGLSAFAWTSEAGQKIEKLPAK